MLPARRLVVEPALSSVVVYHYPACGTCRSALAFLRARGVARDLVDIVKDPPSAELLEEALARSGLPLRRLFNTSGVSYREGGFKDRVDTDPREALLAALAADGKLIRRPLVLAGDAVLVGFDAELWSHTFPGAPR